MLSAVSEVWSAGLSTLFEPSQDELVERLRPQEGERWLDVGGLGGVAVRAARAGADVTAIEADGPLLEQARRAADEAGVDVRLDLGDVEYLPYEDACFDVLSSHFGFIFAPDHANVAAELARVSGPGGRLGFTAWKPNRQLGELYRAFTDEPIEGREAYEWGREDHVEDMLGDDFALDFHDGVLWLTAESGEDVWELFAATAPPVMTLRERLDGERAEEFHRAFVALYEEYREDDGIRAPRRYLLVLGRRR
jgi:SAM-dependent methyltransferase